MTSDVRVLVDGFLQARKSLAGIPAWVEDLDRGTWRWTRAIEIDGELRGLTLLVKAYPQENPLKFRIMINATRCVWRLDVANDQHVNPLSAPAHAGLVIVEPHYHAWADNRIFATANSLPSKLKNARIFPDKSEDFAAMFRWFCAQTAIVVGTSDVPILPQSGKLL